MNYRVVSIFALGLLTMIAVCSAASAAPPNDPQAVDDKKQPEKQSKSIPLDQIWAYNMPATLNAEELDTDERGKTFMEIRRSLWTFPSKDKDAKPAFAVLGKGSKAMRGAHAVLVEEKKPQQTFPADSDISVVFFSFQNTPYVHLHKVERQGNVVNVHYRFVPHETEETTEHFALIPLGKLPTGKYRVNVIRSPMPQKYIDIGFRPKSEAVARSVVSGPFSFSVSKQGK